MPKTTIRQDSHGPYVKTGGYVFRPCVTNYTEHLPKFIRAGQTRFTVDQPPVRATT